MRDPGGLPLMLRGLPVVDEVIVVTPAPVSLAACPDARVIRPGRPGPGNALATGLAAATGDVIVTLNGDGSTDPAEIPRYVEALVAGADVVLGSRYRPGGRDLTGGRFRRWAALLLVGIVNMLFRTRRTDVGFGYAALWRDVLGGLDLPDPSGRLGATWGDGPELLPMLALRPAARGLRVAEVASVAYPRMGRALRAERPGAGHWLRVIAAEHRRRRGRHWRPPVPEAAGVADPGPGSSAGTAGGPLADGVDVLPVRRADGLDELPIRRADGVDVLPVRRADAPAEPKRRARGRRWTDAAGRPESAAAAGPGTPPSSSPSLPPPRQIGFAARSGEGPAGRPASDQQGSAEPLWGPPRRRPSPARDLWRAGDNPIAHQSPRPIANGTPDPLHLGHTGRTTGPDTKPRSAEDGRPDPSAPPQPPAQREVGTKRRRIEGLRQRPDLRVINGEGTGGGRTRSGRLRPVPRES
ncbi:glycosyltransferase [Actinoplanes sp. CA-030573]|uniref:glycosyltransferase n=1 Tax=Actinoplanes sp. CA-030573 TaxID=3239898 RepID=UPI003D8C7379